MSEQVLLVLWWSALASLVLVLLCVGTVTAFYWREGNLTFFQCCENVSFFKVVPVYTYLNELRAMYRKKHPRASILQIMAGYCKLFERERIAVLWIGYRPIVFFFKPEMVEALLNNSIYIGKSVEYKLLQPWLGTGLLTSTGDKWRSHRKLLTPSFHFQILENFMSVFNEQATILSEKLESAVGKPWIHIVTPITMCTLDTISKTAMGVNLNTQSGCCKEYVAAIEQISDVFMYRVLRPWLWFDPIFFYIFPSGWRFRQNVKLLHDFTRKVIKEKKECMMNQNNEKIDKPKKKAFLELLLEHHLKDETFTEEHIREEVDTFMFEGHDTTAMSICWTLYELGRNPKFQEKVFQELDGIYGYDKERPVTSEDLKQMKYMDCTIKESLRLYPSVAFIARQLKEDLKINDITLKPGCTCLICIFVLHMDPQQFPEPDIFNPDRFLPENCKRHPFAYIPFSAGSRNCIGQKFALMEEKTVLAHILRKFKVTSLDPRDKIELLAGLILKSPDPIRINFELRTIEDSC